MDLKSEQNRKIETQKYSNSYFGAGPAECADAAEALESVSSRVLVWHASSPERGRRIETRRAHSAGPQHIATSAGSPETEGTNGRDKQNNSRRENKMRPQHIETSDGSSGTELNINSHAVCFVCPYAILSVCLSVCQSGTRHRVLDGCCIWYLVLGILYLV